MKTAARLGLVTLIALGASGCVYVNGEFAGHEDWKKEQRLNREVIAQLEMGMQRAAVVGKLGTPSDSEAFDRQGEEVRVLFYRTQRKHSDGETTRDEATPLVFENDVLIGWGDTVYAELRP